MNTKRRYRKIDATVIARFQAEKALQGNGTAAVRVLEPDVKQPEDRAVAISAKVGQLIGVDYVNKRIDEIAEVAIDRIGELVQSTDEAVASRNAQFVVDHARGKAVQRNESKNFNINIQSVLD